MSQTAVWQRATDCAQRNWAWELFYNSMVVVMEHEVEDHERKWQQRHCVLQGQGFTIPAESAAPRLHCRCQMYGRCFVFRGYSPILSHGHTMQYGNFTFCRVQRGKKVVGGGGKSQERLLVEQVRIVMRIRSQLASETYLAHDCTPII